MWFSVVLTVGLFITASASDVGDITARTEITHSDGVRHLKENLEELSHLNRNPGEVNYAKENLSEITSSQQKESVVILDKSTEKRKAVDQNPSEDELLPYNFSWLLEGQLAGTNCPTSNQEMMAIYNTGVRYVITLSPEYQPKHKPDYFCLRRAVRPSITSLLRLILCSIA